MLSTRPGPIRPHVDRCIAEDAPLRFAADDNKRQNAAWDEVANVEGTGAVAIVKGKVENQSKTYNSQYKMANIRKSLWSVGVRGMMNVTQRPEMLPTRDQQREIMLLP